MRLPRYALFVLGLTYALLIVGGLVHNTRSSLACPDWPLCFGSAFPKMEGGVLVEHGHRLLATSVGLATIGLLVGLWRRAQRSGDRGLVHLGALALVLVIAQGVLGGLTVIFRLPTLVSTTHLAVSMLFFSLVIYINFRLRPTTVRAAEQPRGLVRATRVGAVVVYLQMIVGALMRHLGAGLACTELPLCAGGVWPAGEHPNVLLHASHRILGVLVLAVVCWVAIETFRATTQPRARLLAAAAPALVLVQGALGWLSVSSFLDVVPVTAHLGVAALILADQVALHLLVRAPARLATYDEPPVGEPALEAVA